MYIIGERLNGMFMNVRAAIEQRDRQVIHDLVKAQLDGGANALDLNVGPAAGNAAENMIWLVETAREATDASLWIDTPKWSVVQEVIPRTPGKKAINSTKADEEALEKYIGLAAGHGAGVIALTIDKAGVPNDAEKRIELGALILTKAMEGGLPIEDLYIDPIILPVNVAPAQPKNVLEAVRQLATFSDPPPHLVIGLSNLSQKCSNNHLINRTFLAMAMAAGLDSAILDPCDVELVNTAITTELLLGKAIYCDGFLEAYRLQSRG
jgi:5-methyltetrahydrofolate corrinoid/iron sulfur protein methyltransferase